MFCHSPPVQEEIAFAQIIFAKSARGAKDYLQMKFARRKKPKREIHPCLPKLMANYFSNSSFENAFTMVRDVHACERIQIQENGAEKFIVSEVRKIDQPFRAKSAFQFLVI